MSHAEAPASGLLYESLPYPETQPSALAALARLFGRRPVPVARARILELGCAGGGNLVPLASRYPQSECLGIDLLPAHVAQAQAAADALGLANLRVVAGDLAGLQPLSGEYDYVICHGVYSWCGPAAQAGIWRLLARHLAPQGVVYLSANVWPGWHLRGALRDGMRLGDDPALPPRERAARARAWLARMVPLSDPATPWGVLLRQSHEQLAAQSDSYLLGEYLAPVNQPSHFAELARAARESGLVHLCDARPSASHPGDSRPELHAAAQAEAGADPVAYQQALDWLQGRPFRQTLWVRADGPLPPGPQATGLAGLHAAAALQREGDDASGAARFRDAQGQRLSTNDPLVVAALDRLGAQHPGTVPVDDLLAGAEAEVPGGAARLAQALLQMVVAGPVQLLADPVQAGQADAVRPEAWALARWQAAQGQAWVTSLRHGPVRVDATGRALLQMANGQLDRAALAALLARAWPGAAAPASSQMDAVLQQALQRMAAQALLVP